MKNEHSDERIDLGKVKKLYDEMDEIWPKNDLWYSYTYRNICKYIDNFLKENNIKDCFNIVNIGSGGNEYHIPGEHYHIDISSKNMDNLQHFFVGNAEDMPFDSNFFDVGLCVGSVINYCDPVLVIKEISRVLKPRGKCVLDFEQTKSLQFLGTSIFHSKVSLINSFNNGNIDTIWVFALSHIKKICKYNDLKISNVSFFHLLSPLIYRITKDEQYSSRYCKHDSIIKYIPILSKLSCNVIMTLEKSR